MSTLREVDVRCEAFDKAIAALNPEECAGAELESRSIESAPELLGAARASLEVGVGASAAWYDGGRSLTSDTTHQEQEIG